MSSARRDRRSRRLDGCLRNLAARIGLHVAKGRESIKELEHAMFRDPRGCIIHDRGRALVGAVQEVYCDPDTLKPEFAEVALARGVGSGEDSLLYPWEGLFWTPAGSLFMNDWIQEATRCRAHAFEKVMHLRAYALETLDQALQRNPLLSL